MQPVVVLFIIKERVIEGETLSMRKDIAGEKLQQARVEERRRDMHLCCNVGCACRCALVDGKRQ